MSGRRPPPLSNTDRRARGLSLVELMVALVVVAILSAIAVPGYGSVMQRVNRNDARMALLRLQHLQERHYSAHLRYAERLGTPGDEITLPASPSSDAGHYQLSLSVSSEGQRFLAVATARPDGRQSSDSACQKLSVDETGRRRAAGQSGAWRDEDPQRCWG